MTALLTHTSTSATLEVRDTGDFTLATLPLYGSGRSVDCADRALKRMRIKRVGPWHKQHSHEMTVHVMNVQSKVVFS